LGDCRWPTGEFAAVVVVPASSCPPAGAEFVDRTVDQVHVCAGDGRGHGRRRWRVIKTLGHKMVRFETVNRFAAETSSAVIIGVASHFGIPVSTAHNVSAAIMGVGAAKRLNALKWTIVEKMVWAWLLTIPISGTIAYMLMRLLLNFGLA